MKILRRQKFGYALSLFLYLVGVISLLATLWKTWPQVSSAKNSFSTFLTLLWTDKFSFLPGIEFKLVYLVILADAAFISGVIIHVLSVQQIIVPGKIVYYQCPFCNKDWKSSGDKALVHCPHCRQLVHPIIIERKGS